MGTTAALSPTAESSPRCHFALDIDIENILKIYNFSVSLFEFDRRKSSRNKRKHGIDFIEARELWRDPDVIQAPGLRGDEERILVVGKINESHWTAVITYREDRIRIISVRRARRREIENYESQRV